MNQNFYYKIISRSDVSSFRRGNIIDTSQRVDNGRVGRNKQLLLLFNLIYKFSKKKKMAVGIILNQNCHLEGKSLLRFRIKKEAEKICFSPQDGCYFIDYILEKARVELEKKEKLKLPSKFNSCCFWENKEDCEEYLKKLGVYGSLPIIKVKIIETVQSVRLDNNQIPDASSPADIMLNQAKICLQGVESKKPLYEFVFRGKFQVVECL